MRDFKYIIKLILFWMSFFLVNRILFAFFFANQVTASSFVEIIEIFPSSIGLDISFISYLLCVLFLVLLFNSFYSHNRLIERIIYLINVLLLISSGIVNGAEVALYSEWNTKLNLKAFTHLLQPSEVLASASIKHILTTLLFLFISLQFISIYKKWIHANFSKPSSISLLYRVLLIPLVGGVLFLGARGGTKEIPINISDAYFSKNIILNDIAVNSNWNLVYNILHASNITYNPYIKHSEEEASEFILNLRNIESDTNIMVIQNQSKNPNIVIILLESWSADNIENLGGLKGVTPNFQRLEEEGLLFTNFYSNGWTSDQGIASIFSSFPVFPYVAIVNDLNKSRKLPSLNSSLNEYHSSFFFGGQLTYGNIKGYLIANNFDLIKDRKDYIHLPSGRLGVHDEFMFSEFQNELSLLQEPFISTLFTISSHSPFDFPSEHKLTFNSAEDNYINSVAYTDKCLGDFMASVQDEDWYTNTLFIIVADHSHASPFRRRIAQKERYKIPMLWFGDILKQEYQGKKYNKMGSHIDITPSLLSQLDIDYTDSYWGHNLFNSELNSFVPYAFHKGYGLMNNDNYYAFSEDYQKVFEHHAIDSLAKLQIKRQAELYFQEAFKQYLDL